MSSTLSAPAPKRLVGRIWAEISITNRADAILARHGAIPSSGVRRVDVSRVLIDTGATSLCLPPEIIAQLGLELLQEVTVETAMGVTTARVFQDATLTVEGRTRTFECLELPGGKQPLLGVIPLESLGIDLDLANERMVQRPDWGEDTYITIL